MNRTITIIAMCLSLVANPVHVQPRPSYERIYWNCLRAYIIRHPNYTEQDAQRIALYCARVAARYAGR